jgi:hypothetical protein
MDTIIKDGDYEIISIKHKSFYKEYIRAITIVKQFIIKKKLIIYGGSAIDFALRLKGEFLYDDEILKFADLDFYSPIHAEHAYELADELHKDGFPDVRAIGAAHHTTMRVDAVNALSGNFVADISYIPENLISRIPTLEFQGMKFVHPQYQYIDQHNSLYVPYYGTPYENIFNRCKKDIERFNKLYKFYPFKKETIKFQTNDVKLSSKYVMTGFSAYSILYHKFIDELKIIDKDIIPLLLNKSPLKYLDICHLNPNLLFKEIANGKHYYPFASIIPEIYLFEKEQLRVFSTENEMVAINEVIVGGVNMRIVNIQGLLKWLLVMYYCMDDNRDLYLQFYISALTMIQHIDENYDKLDHKIADIFLPSINVYGSDNISPTQKISMSYTRYDLYDEEMIYSRPANYYPNRGKPHPVFDYNAPFFQIDGTEISN